MTAQEYLETIKIMSRKVRLMRSELKMLHEALDITGISYENIGAGSGTRKTDTMADAILKTVDFEDKVRCKEYILAQMILKATAAINALESETQREVLVRWYLMGEPVSLIMKRMSYSRSSVYGMRNDALKNIPDFESLD